MPSSPTPSRTRPVRPPWGDVLAAVALVALPFLLYRGALGLWWTEDDFFQLRYALAHGPAAYGLDPEVWRLLPNRVLSPLLFVSYDLDLALFGPDLASAAAFYAHQLVSIGLAAAMLFLVLRLWLPAAWAGAGGLAFLLGPPVASLASHLMVRHYPEAIALGLAAAALWVLAVRAGDGARAWGLTLASAPLYLAASLAKEIAVPLPLFLALLPEGDRRTRLRLLGPHAGVLALYAVYRAWMLGTPLGGYGFVVTPAAWPRLALALPGKIGRELAAGGGWGWAALAVLLAPVAVLVARSRTALRLTAAGAVLALLPVLPVSVEVEPRYAVAAWLAVAAALPFGLRATVAIRRSGRAVIAGVLGLVLLAGLALERSAWADARARAGRLSAEYRGFLELGAGELLRRPLGPPASMDQLGRFAREVLDRPAAGDWFYDDLYLCGDHPADASALPADLPGTAIHEFDPQTGRVEEITGEIGARAREYCAAIRWDAPLEAELLPEPHGVLAWRLGPYRDGDYAFVLEDGRSRYDLPRAGAFHLGGLSRLALRVRYASPDGWVTYSPEIDLDLRSGKRRRWRR